MTRPHAATRAETLPAPRMLGALMLGAALALVPLFAHAQAPAAPAATTGAAASPRAAKAASATCFVCVI